MLWLLLAIPLLVAAYVVVLRRRKRSAVRYASLTLIRDALGPGQRLRRHVPPALLLLALTAAIVALARPTATVTLPAQYMTIAMAMDVSLSMRATDVEPNRLAAAQNAAKAFIEELPADVRLGIVTFAGTAAVVQTPTDSKQDMIAAIDRFQLQRATATGSGLILSLGMLFPDDGLDLESVALQMRPAGVSLDSSRRDGLHGGTLGLLLAPLLDRHRPAARAHCRLEVEAFVRKQHAECVKEPAAGRGGALQLEAVDRVEHVLPVLGWRLHDGGGAGEGDDAQPHIFGQILDETLGRGLCRTQARRFDVGRLHAA